MEITRAGCLCRLLGKKEMPVMIQRVVQTDQVRRRREREPREQGQVGCPNIELCVHLVVCLLGCTSIGLCVCLIVCLSAWLSGYLVWLSASLCICLSAYLRGIFDALRHLGAYGVKELCVCLVIRPSGCVSA